MRYSWILTAAVVLVSMAIAFGAFAGDYRDDGMLIEYPDGNYGIDMGGGYQTIPDKKSEDGQKTMLPPVYRDEYSNTQYGPMTHKGLPIFPDFRWEKKKEEDKKKEQKDQVFYESTGASHGALLGVSAPRKKKQ
jgi:hypothetical protein